ncbi:hypothetical protein C6568_06220 [Melaminivora suipulveris]|uniref:Uncharacterized protein n=1 Tax=Melaminivora suipulveris TaxID=2109913 RepID=A0A2R3QGV3_9BURK|nr:hypothetical protein [Melaminivora suipulveris]AVO50993.1 hypothetical protein C6568_06220 [Melaminivora suipulveris]
MPAFWNNRLVRRALPAFAQPPAEGSVPASQPVHTLELDARTEWPTHRIRSFLSMREAQQQGHNGR